MNNKCLIIYESIYNGNTAKLARAMAQTLGCQMVEAKRALSMDLDSYRTIGFGSGIYFGSHHPVLFEAASKQCADICPMGIIRLENRKAISYHELDCTLCSLCVDNCRQQAITLHYNWRDAINVAKRHAPKTSLW
ncbi:MAG: flavodoxin domain-containing protein [Bacteroidales bacterium]